MDYIKGIIFVILGITFLNLFGKRLTKDESSFSRNLLTGYVLYTAMQAVLGIFTQVIGLEFMYYKIAMIMLVAGILFFTFRYSFKSFDIKKSLVTFFNHIELYKIIYIIASILLIFSLLNISYMWMGNHQDDGLYLLKTALLPAVNGDYTINYTTGLTDQIDLVRAVNTFELDYAFWIDLTGIYPAVFCKAVMVFFNYVLVLNGFNLIIHLFRKEKKNKASIFLCSILFFCILPETLVNHNLLMQQDAWHFSAAMWYGSGLVRCLGIILLVLPFLENDKLTWKNIIWYGITSLALMSKASQALPLIILAATSILIFKIILCIKKGNKLALLAIIAIIIFLLMIPEKDEALTNHTFTVFSALLKTKLFIITLLFFVLSPFLLKNKMVIKFTSVLMTMFILAMVPNINMLFIRISMFDFVIGRTVTAFSFYIILLATVYGGLVLEKYFNSKKPIKLPFIIFSIICAGIYLISLQNNYGILETMKIIRNNPRLIPESTHELSTKLDDLSNKTEASLYVMGASWIEVNGYTHSLGITLRIDAPNIYSVPAIPRFSSMNNDSAFKTFYQGHTIGFETFEKYPESKDSVNFMRNMLDEFPINVIYTQNTNASSVLQEQFGYHRVDEVKGSKPYEILVNDELYQTLLNK